jgi:hypothetical protein
MRTGDTLSIRSILTGPPGGQHDGARRGAGARSCTLDASPERHSQAQKRRRARHGASSARCTAPSVLLARNTPASDSPRRIRLLRVSSTPVTTFRVKRADVAPDALRSLTAGPMAVWRAPSGATGNHLSGFRLTSVERCYKAYPVRAQCIVIGRGRVLPGAVDRCQRLRLQVAARQRTFSLRPCVTSDLLAMADIHVPRLGAPSLPTKRCGSVRGENVLRLVSRLGRRW